MAAGSALSATFRDAKNQTSTVRWHATPPATGTLLDTALALATAAAACSNAHLDTYTGAASAAPVAGSSSGKWIDVEDKLVVVVQTAAGTVHRYEIPAPKDSCFLADGETMDGAGPGQSYGAALITNATSKDGDLFTATVGGYRRRVKLQRRFNVRTRNPALSGQGL